MTPCCVPIENGKWHVVRGACGQIFLPLSFSEAWRHHQITGRDAPLRTPKGMRVSPIPQVRVLPMS